MSYRPRFSATATLMAIIVAGAAAPYAHASGFQLREQSASGLGNAFAGASAGALDISSMYWNPAVLSQYQGTQVIVGGTFIGLTMELTGATGTRAPNFQPSQQSISGPSSMPNAASNPILPAIYMSYSLSPDVTVGVSVNVPFGLATTYSSNFVGRYHALKTDMKIIDVTPNIAFKLTPELALGGALVVRKTEAEISSAADFGAIGAARGVPGSIPGANDGLVTMKGDTWTYGIKAGFTYQPSDDFRLGVGYQGPMTLKVDGKVTYTNVPAAFQSVFANGGGKADVKLPDTFTAGFVFNVSKDVSLQGEAARTGWARFDELRLRFASGAPDSVTQEKWKNTWFFSLGGTMKVNAGWTVRAGVASDKSPIDEAYRTPRIPDGDRYWLSLGAGYTLSKATSLDFGFTHIFARASSLALASGTNPTGDNFFRGSLTGSYKIGANILAVQMRHIF